MPHYLHAYMLHIAKKDNEALLQITNGNEEKDFNSYSRARFFAVVEAAEAINYPKFTARQHAINFFIPSELYSKLVDLCQSLIKIDKKQDARKECLIMGEKIESSGLNTYEKLQGFLIQSIALRESSDPKDIELLTKISSKQREILKNSPKLLKIPLSDIPEAVWLQYFEIFFTKDEDSAVSFVEEYHNENMRQGQSK
ncbi:MAG: hypothetical protein AB1442_05335 [Nitrospirota bacterium]